MARARLLSIFVSVIALPALALAQSNNIDLFSFVMPDAQLIAGVHVDAAKSSAFGQFVLSQTPIGDKLVGRFITETGIDPRSDVTEVVAAWNGAPNANGHWLIGAHGTFSAAIETIEVNALKNGGTIARLPGVDLITTGPSSAGMQAPNVCIGLFTDGFTDVAGDCSSVQAATQAGLGAGGTASSLLVKAQQLRAQQDLWFVSSVPLSQFAHHAGANPTDPTAGGPAGNLGGVLNTNLFQAVQQIGAGVKFASDAQATGAQVSAEVILDSPQNATSLLNVVNFIASMLQMNAGSLPPADAGLAALLSNFQATVSGNTLNIALNIPESTLEQLFQHVGQLASN